MSGDWEPVSGFEPLTVRLQEGLAPSEPSATANCASPILPALWLVRANETHSSSVAAVCRVVPYCLWVSCGFQP